MPQRAVSIHPAALEEAEAALDWYAKRSRGAAERFQSELESCIDRIADYPDQFSLFVFGTRRVTLRRFPYLIIFRVMPSSIEIIAIAHGRRRPGYWRDRS